MQTFISGLALICLSATANETQVPLSSEKRKWESNTLESLATSYWGEYWTKNSETSFTSYEEWSIELKDPNQWTDPSQA